MPLSDFSVPVEKLFIKDGAVRMNSHTLEQAEKIIYTVVLFTGFFIWPFISRRISEEARRIVCLFVGALDIILFIAVREMWKMNLLIFYVCLFACWLEVKFPKTKAKWHDDVVPVWQHAVILIGEIMFCLLLTEWIWFYLS